MYYKSKTKINYKEHIKQEKILKNNIIENFIGTNESNNRKRLSYKKYLKQQEMLYREKSMNLEENTKSFKEKIKIFNLKEGKSFSLSHDFLQISKDNYLWFTYNQKLLEEKMMRDGGYVALFLTLTLNSTYHRYSKVTKKYNPLYNKENTIKKGYELLNSSFKEIYKNFRVNRKYQRVFFSKVIEPHKNLTPHLHSIIYVKEEFKNSLKKHIKNIIEKNSLGRYDIEDILDITRSTSYLLKYIKKSTDLKDAKDYHFYNGWKKFHKLRTFTISNMGLERYLFKKINQATKITKNLKDKNPLTQTLELCNILVTIEDKETKEIFYKKYEKQDARYNIKVKRVRSKKKSFFEVPEQVIYDYFSTISNYEQSNLLKACYEFKDSIFTKELFNRLFDYVLKRIYEGFKDDINKVLENGYNERTIEKILQYQINFDNFKKMDKRKIKKVFEKRALEYIKNNFKENCKDEFFGKIPDYYPTKGNLNSFVEIFNNIFNIFSYTYKIKEFIIFDNKKKIEIYNKANFIIDPLFEYNFLKNKYLED